MHVQDPTTKLHAFTTVLRYKLGAINKETTQPKVDLVERVQVLQFETVHSVLDYT